jgi:hypothetical protein
VGAEVYDITVTGGTNSTAASYADMAWVAGRARELAEDLHTEALSISALSYEPMLTDTADLSPVTYRAVQEAFDRAVHDPGGMFAVEAAMERRSADLTAAIANYRDADDRSAALMRVWTWFQGASQFNWLRMAYIYDNYEMYGEEWLVEHPGTIQDTIAAAPSATLIPFSVSQVAGELALLWGDGEGHARPLDQESLLGAGAARQVPTSLGNVFQSLTGRSDASSKSHDQIDVRTITQPDGSTSYIVDIPGTRDWNAPNLAGQTNANTNDLTTNIEAMSETSTAREEAIAQALFDVHAPSTAPVMLVGHSQGGIVAAQAAADSADGTFGYNVTHVVTAGSPISNANIPPGVQVLALENEGDIVPTLDGADNPDTSNVTTVHFENQTGTVGGNHALGDPLGRGDENYVAVAQTLDQSDDPAIRAYLASASDFILADPTGATVTVTGFELTRD